MGKKDAEKNIPKEKFKTKIGGQAVNEGIMMKSDSKYALACRMPDGSIDMEVWDGRYKDAEDDKDKPWYVRTIFIRGIFNFAFSLIDSYKCMGKSAQKLYDAGAYEDEEDSKLDIWLEEHFGKNAMKVLMGAAMIIGIVLAVFLFMYLPAAVISLVKKVFEGIPAVVLNVFEGLIKIAIFVGYTAITACMDEIKITYEYHGAEHKAIACYEHGEELTVENVKKYKRFHPRCGTSFIFLVLFISIFVNTIFRVTWGSKLVRMGIKLLLLPIVMGIAYEFIRLAGKYDNIFTRIISAPGLWIQRITTNEPNEKQIECAIAALKEVIPENEEDCLW